MYIIGDSRDIDKGLGL